MCWSSRHEREQWLKRQREREEERLTPFATEPEAEEPSAEVETEAGEREEELVRI